MRCFPVSGVAASLRYHDLPGANPPIVFVHGLGCASSCDYPGVAAQPSLAGRRRLLVDLLGAGFSDRPEEFAYTVEAHARAVAALIEGLDLSAVDLVGHSAGGAIAIVTAGMVTSRIGRLILSEPNLDPGGGFFSCQIASRSEQHFVEHGHAQMVTDTQWRGDPVWAGSLAASDPRAVHRLAQSLVDGSTPTWREQLLALPMPRTVIFGERSLPDPDTERLATAGIGVRVIAGVGHSMATEDPVALGAVLGSLSCD